MSTLADPQQLISAAGGVVWRPGPDGELETALVHRPKYDDWSLPKGKLEAGENALVAAVREVGEETGLEVVVGRRSVQTRYTHRGGPKRVDYWVMRAVGGALMSNDFAPNDEVDELRWLPLAAATDLVTHDHDRAVLADLGRPDLPRMPRLVLVRHACAGERADWDGPDGERPLDRRGREQAATLAAVLPLFGPTRLLSAPPARCRQTMQPLAAVLDLPVAEAPELGEEAFGEDPRAGLAVAAGLLGDDEGDRPGVTVVCSQGGAIPSVLLALGVRWSGDAQRPDTALPDTALWPPSAKGSAWVLGGRPGQLSADYYRDFGADPS